MKDFFADGRLDDGLSYTEYEDEWRDIINRSKEGLTPKERRYQFYAQYNWDRSQGVIADFEPGEALHDAVGSITDPQIWMVLTEDWCGDSAFSLPIIALAADLNDNVTLRILRRDENLDIMDKYLTSGSRSIPKLVAFSTEGEELFQWGPRPRAAAELRKQLKAKGKSGKEISNALIEWYQDGGYEMVEDELVERLTRAVPA